MYITYVIRSLAAVRSLVFMVMSESKQKDQRIWPRCRWLQLGLVPMATGWRHILAKYLDTVQYSNRIRSQWIFVFDSIRIPNFKDIRFKWNSRFVPSVVCTTHECCTKHNEVQPGRLASTQDQVHLASKHQTAISQLVLIMGTCVKSWFTLVSSLQDV